MPECFRGLIDFPTHSPDFMPFFCSLLKNNQIAEVKYTQVTTMGRNICIYFEAFTDKKHMFLANENFGKMLAEWWKNSSKNIDFDQDFIFEINWIGKCPNKNNLYCTVQNFWLNANDDRPIGYSTFYQKNIRTMEEWNRTWQKDHLFLLEQQNNLQK